MIFITYDLIVLNGLSTKIMNQPDIATSGLI